MKESKPKKAVNIINPTKPGASLVSGMQQQILRKTQKYRSTKVPNR